MKINTAYILSNINKALAFEWIAAHLNPDKFQLIFILLNPGNSDLEGYLKQREIKVYRVSYSGKKDLPQAIIQVYKIIKKEKIQVVHCHMFDACIAGLVTARLAGIKKRIFTRHHATFHQDYFPRAVYYDKFISYMATDIVAISENVRRTLIEIEGVNPGKITLIHHGFQLEGFEQTDEQKRIALANAYKTNGKFPVIGVISRYFELKGIQYIIPAFKHLLQEYPEAYLVLANANGNYSKEIKTLLKELPEERYIEIPFESDIFTLYKLFDIFIHVPIDPSIEAFGQTYVEALAAGIPSIFTLSGIAPEFIKDCYNALVVDFKDWQSIYQSLNLLLNDADLRQSLVQQGKKDVYHLFTLGTMIQKLESIYTEKRV